MKNSMNQAFCAPSIGRALITGASRRVGRAIAIELARCGMNLELTYRRSRDECEECARLAQESGRSGGFSITTTITQLDLSDLAQVDALGVAIAKRGVDVVVHNASSMDATPLGSMTALDFERLYRVEVVAPMRLTQALAPVLARSALAAKGAVVFLSDAHALGIPRAGFAGYLVAKAAVRALAQQFAVELAPDVRVHCVAPGVVMWPENFPDATKTAILSRTPLARAGTAHEAAQLVRFLALEASYLTGETIRIDGGRSLR